MLGNRDEERTMSVPVLSNRALAWVTFCRGDGVEVLDDTSSANEPLFTQVTDVEGEYVHTANGGRWQQGTGEEIVYVREGRAETTVRRRLRLTEKGRAAADRDEWQQRRRA